MKKLELKHLAPYLPYGLKIQGNTHGEIAELSCVTETSVNIKDRGFTYGMWGDIYDIKPILRPLSDLFKVINHNGKEFKPLDFIKDQCEEDYFVDTEFESYILNRRGNSDYLSHAMNYLPYGLTNQFIEWHFDVFNLIPNGLAIDINTLEL